MFHWVPNTSPIIVSEYLSAFSIITFTLNKSSSEAVVHRCFLQLLQYSQENTCVGVTLTKFPASKPANLLKRVQHSCFPMNIAKFLRTFFIELIQ